MRFIRGVWRNWRGGCRGGRFWAEADLDGSVRQAWTYRMVRLTLTLSMLASMALLASCDRSEIEAINADVSLGDQCFYALAQRPDDCFERAPCMWSDAVVSVREDDAGAFRLEASSGGWELPSDQPQRTTSASAMSPDALARQLPELLATLHDAPPPVTQACVLMHPDQDMRFADVAAFHKALTAQRVRHVSLFVELADDK